MRDTPRIDGFWSLVRRHSLALSLAILVLSFGLLALNVQGGPTRLDLLMGELVGPSGRVDRAESIAATFWRDVTVLGGGPVVTLVVTLSLGYMLLARHTRSALALLACIAAASASLFVLKWTFQRARPTELEFLIGWDQFSFPSGHSTISGLVYPTLFALLSRFVRGRRLKAYCVSCGLLLMVLIGVSRVYLRMHYATDVLSGWAVGLSWSLLSWVAVGRLQKQGLVEREPMALQESPTLE